MSTGPTTLPASGDAGADARRRRMPRLRDARIRSKLALILVVPVAAVIALATVRLVAVGEGATTPPRLARSPPSPRRLRLTQDLHAERMAAAAYLAAPQPAGRRVQPAGPQTRRAGRRVPRRASPDRRRPHRGPRPADRHRRPPGHPRRHPPGGAGPPADGRSPRPRSATASSLDRPGRLRRRPRPVPGEESLADSRRALAAFARAKAAVAEEEAVAFTALAGRTARRRSSSPRSWPP